MKKTLISFLFLLGIYTAFACMNSFEKIPGIEIEEDYSFGVEGPFLVDLERVRQFIKEKEASCNKKINKECSDLAIGYMYNKEYQKALELSKQLVIKYPQEYSVVITHSVALELNGKYAEALIYLRKAVKIDPNSHNDSEWIHEIILQNIIKNNLNPMQSILGLDFGNSEKPENIHKLSNDSINKLRMMLAYQLNDRLYFVGKYDPLYGSLVYDFANLLFMDEIGRSNAYQHFVMAKEYGFSTNSLDDKIFYTQDYLAVGEDYLPGVNFGMGLISNEYAHSEINDSIVRASIYQLVAQDMPSNHNSFYITMSYKYLHQYDSALYWSYIACKRYPNNFRVARQHAYILELNKKYDESLILVRKLKMIDTSDHRYSDSYWINEKILEAKMSGKIDLEKSILGFDFGQEALPQKTNTSDIQMSIKQLMYQLNLRIDFEKKNNPIYASLLFDYANLVALTHSPNEAHWLYNKAKEYEYSLPIIDERINAMGQSNDLQIAENINNSKGHDWFIISIVLIIISVSIYYGFHKN